MKQTLLPKVANPQSQKPAHNIKGPDDIACDLKKPEFLGLFATLMQEAGISGPLTLVAQQPVKGTPHSKGLQLHHFQGPGILLRWHAPESSNDRNIQFLVRTPTAIVGDAEQFHQRVSQAFDRLVMRQRIVRDPEHKPNGKGTANAEVTGATEVTEEPVPDMDEQAIELLFIALSEKKYILSGGIIARRRIREELVVGHGMSNAQAIGIMGNMVNGGVLVYCDHNDFYGLGETWIKYIPLSEPVKSLVETAGDEASSAATPVEPQAGATGASQEAPVQSPVPPVEPVAEPKVAKSVEGATNGKKPVSVQTQLARLVRNAEEAARKKRRLIELNTERGGVVQLHETLAKRLEGLDADIALLMQELDDPKLRDAESRLEALRGVLGDE